MKVVRGYKTVVLQKNSAHQNDDCNESRKKYYRRKRVLFLRVLSTEDSQVYLTLMSLQFFATLPLSVSFAFIALWLTGGKDPIRVKTA